MDEQLWILVGLAGAIAVLSLIALILFTPPRPSVPQEGPIRFSVRPFTDLAPDPQHMYLGDGVARDMVALLENYQRIEATVDEAPARFVLQGAVKRTGPNLSMKIEVTSDGRRYWKGAYDAQMKDVPKAQSKAIAALAKRMKLPPKSTQAS